MATNMKRTLDVLNVENTEFSSLLLAEDVLKGLKKLGFKNPSPVQLKSIPLGKCGLDMIVQAKSGTGKTCVFAVIALEMVLTSSTETQVIILAPTREIAVQVQGVLSEIGSFKKNLNCHVFIGGTSLEDDKKKLRSCHIAIGTPGRLKTLIELEHLKTDFVRLFILDEADKLLEPGSFQEQINWIFSTLPKHKQMLALSATYPEYLAKHLNNYMNEPIHVRLNTEEPTLLGIKQFYLKVPSHHLPHVVFNRKAKRLTRFLRNTPFQQCMVFSNYQTRAQILVDILSSEGWPASCISGNQSQEERLKAMKKLKKFQCRILVSTDLTSRGIDCDKVDLVINMDLPWDTETYLHRVGRAGRFGGYGLAVSFIAEGDEELKLKNIADEIKYDILFYPDTNSGVDDDVVSQQRIYDTKSETQERSSKENSGNPIPDMREEDKQEHMAKSGHQNFMDDLHDSLAANQNGSLNDRGYLNQEDAFLEINFFSNSAEECLDDAVDCSAEQSLGSHGGMKIDAEEKRNCPFFVEGKIHTERAVGVEILASDSKICEKQSMDKPESILTPKRELADSESTEGLQINSGTRCLHDICSCPCSDYAGDQQDDISKSDLGVSLLASDKYKRINDTNGYASSERLSDSMVQTKECCNGLMKGDSDNASSKPSDEYADCEPKIENSFVGDSSNAEEKSNNRKVILSCDLEKLLENFLCEEITESGVRCLDEHYKQMGVGEIKTNRSNQTSAVFKSKSLDSFDPEENDTEIMRVKEQTTNNDGGYLSTGVSEGSFSENLSYASSIVNADLDNTSVSFVMTHQTSESAGLDEDRERNGKDVNIINDSKELPNEFSDDSQVDSVTADAHLSASENEVVFKPYRTRKQRKDPNKLLCTCVEEKSQEQRATQSSLIRKVRFLQAWNNAYNSQVAWLQHYRRQFKTF
eukprot:gene2068-17635_t